MNDVEFKSSFVDSIDDDDVSDANCLNLGRQESASVMHDYRTSRSFEFAKVRRLGYFIIGRTAS